MDKLQKPVAFNSIGHITPVTGEGTSLVNQLATFLFSDDSKLIAKISRTLVTTGGSGRPVFKVFSPEHVSAAEMSRLFSVRWADQSVDWKAYPLYEGRMRERAHFSLAPGLFYINAIEEVDRPVLLD